MDKYIAITLGPIYDTINLASSPAALWAGSYMFSYLSKTICRLLTENGVAEEDILTPYYTAGNNFPQDCDGAGLFHDRIIFRAKNFPVSGFAQIKEAAIGHLAETFRIDAAYLREYLIISAAAVEAENPILDTRAILDCLELAKPIVSGWENNPLLSTLVGEKYHGNEAIKSLPLTQQFTSWQLRNPNGQLRSISDISGLNWNTGMKKHRYYAIVRADGDRMGSIIANLASDQIRDFSRQCILYCAEIAKEVGAFGGAAIYSGGDDLLAIMPCENQQGENIFRFIQKANRIFAEHFPKETYHADVSLSFGVTICYHKFPLYEALEDSQNLLFGLAKSRRNCIAVHLQKHAGQSEGLIIPNDALDAFLFRFDRIMAQRDDQWFQSAHHKIILFRSLFRKAGRDYTQIRNLFANIFDADSHVGNDLLHKELPDFYHELITALGIEAITDLKESDHVDTLCYILRLFKFFVEKGGGEE